MYLAVCDNEKGDLNAVYSLLDAWRIEHDSAVRRKTFQSAVNLLESAREIRHFDDAAEIVFRSTSLDFAYESYGVREVMGLLKEVESTLFHCPEFMRVHRSYIVNMFQVEQLSSAGLRTFQGESLPVSHLLYPRVQKDYLNLLFEGRTNP